MGLQPAPDRGGDPDEEEEEEELREPETAGEEQPAPAAEPLKHVSAGQDLQGLRGRLTVGFELVQTREANRMDTRRLFQNKTNAPVVCARVCDELVVMVQVVLELFHHFVGVTPH